MREPDEIEDGPFNVEPGPSGWTGTTLTRGGWRGAFAPTLEGLLELLAAAHGKDP